MLPGFLFIHPPYPYSPTYFNLTSSFFAHLVYAEHSINNRAYEDGGDSP